jgi:hypothetical protein
MTLAASLRAPDEVPLDIRFAPADAMCLRVRQAGRAPREHWVVAELAVIAGDGPGAVTRSAAVR